MIIYLLLKYFYLKTTLLIKKTYLKKPIKNTLTKKGWSKEFSIQKFQRICGVHFISRWMGTYLIAEFLSWSKKL